MEFIRSLNHIDEYRLDENGLQVLVHEEHSAPVAALMITYRVGSRNEGTGLTGATHFLEHMMFKGTARFNKRDGTSVFNVLQRVGAQINATTWFDRTNYYAVLPTEHLALAADIESDRMRGAMLSDEDVDSERTVILNELDRGENEPLRNLYHAVWSAAFVAHPYHHPTIGWRGDVENVTAAGLKGFYDTYYWPDNATLSIIGDVNRDEALALVLERFSGIPAAPAAIPRLAVTEPVQRGERRVVVRQGAGVGAVVVAFKQPAAADPLTNALDVLTAVLSHGKRSRLYATLTDRGLTTSVSASESRLHDDGLFMVTAHLTPGTAHDAVERVVREELARVVEHGIDDAELDRARTQLLAQNAFGKDGPYAIAARINEAIAAGDWTLYARYPDLIRSVTREQVRDAAARFFTDDRMTVGYHIPTEEA